eukprot:CAMPEP_0119006658 /NCGR_PEP_ID=MMETSP1176-20130426/2442_1 /TAXON_ID=265551 /ORGANISM="Synedropsis recta cf, Strain CCMP1620" /LENGTH=445 /DNA_ID=CAMNT_0006958609 /DNA_START=73 /DNA_END=1407 /DNA_ORIENTATION=-
MAKKKSKGTSAPSKKVDATNGDAAKKTGKRNASKGGGASWIHLVLTVLSFLVGVLTPPILHYVQMQNGVTSSTTNAARKLLVEPSLSCTHDSDELTGFLADEPVTGMHTICLSPGMMTVFRNSKADIAHKVDFSVNNWKALKEKLEQVLNLKNRRHPIQAWALFTKEGERVVDEDFAGDNDAAILNKIATSGVLVIFEGGQWIWPGISEGFARQVSLDFSPEKGHGVLEKRNATLVTLSLNPLVLSVEGFLSEEECNYIQEQANPQMKYSGVSLMDKDKGRPASDFRTSQSTFLGPTYKGLAGVDQRTASLVRIPITHQEHVQVLRYGYTEKYNAHMDYFDPAHYKNDPNTMKTIENGKKNRLATVFWYLSDVPKGGETIFPRAGKAAHPTDMADCSVGLKVKPVRGKVIIFYSMTPEGGFDPYSLHAACPVQEGIKWAANKWVW